MGKLFGLCLILVVGTALLFGSLDDEWRKQCNILCRWLSDCRDRPHPCSGHGLDECIGNARRVSSECRTALEDFAACWQWHPSCREFEAECEPARSAFEAECGNEI